MSIGSKFLDRVLNEGKGKGEGFKFDQATEALKKALRQVGGENNFADKVAEVANMSGVPGRFMNTPGAKESIIAGATALRSRPAVVAAFLALHSALTGSFVAEGKNEEDDLEGAAFQQLVEEVLVALGVPKELVGKDASPQLKSKIRSAARSLMANSKVKEAYKFLAKKLGVKVGDKVVGSKKPGMAVQEATTSGTVGTSGTGDEEDDDVKSTGPVSIDTVQHVLTKLGVNLQDKTSVRIVDQNKLARMMRTALRDPNVKRAVGAFVRIAK